jgi:hypothetical protein
MSRFDSTRRGLLKAAALLPLAGVWSAPARSAAASDLAAADASFAIHPDREGRAVSESLVSLSYETGQLADPEFFSAGNRGLVEMFRRLNPHGVLRIGGNTSDFAVWSAYRGTLPPQPARKGGPQQPVVLRPEALHSLAGFLRATGWRLVFGVNLKIGVPAMAAALAGAVREAVGDRLLAIQIGNEANNYAQDYAAFDSAWLPYAQALRAERLPLAGPDTGANTDWVMEYARRHGRDNVFLSRHYYRDAAPRGSIGDLLGGDPGFFEHMEPLVAAADALGLPLRLTEANSYYFGGRDGVSNVFASALWGADFLLALAQAGVAGVHFHGGTLSSVEASLGREAVIAAGGDPAARRDAVTSRYSAIAGNPALGYQPRPLYYGLLLAQQFGGARLLGGQLDTGGANLSAYAARQGSGLLLALINKDVVRDAAVSLSGLTGYGEGRLRRLSAPALDNRGDIVFDGEPDPGRSVSVDAQGCARVELPRGSAACIRFDRIV